MSDSERQIYINNLSPGDLALLKDIAEVAADRAVKQMFNSMGIGDDPMASQELFGALRKISKTMADDEYMADAIWTRRTRLLMNGAFGKAFFTAVGLAVVGGAHALWSGLRGLMPPGTPPH